MMETDGLFTQYLVPWLIRAGIAVVIAVAGYWLVGRISALIDRLLQKTRIDPILTRFIVTIARTLLLILVFIAALSQLGVDTTSLIALLGAAGLAVGLALKDSLQNFAAGVMLILFRPFRQGDFVEIAGVSGVVDEISLFSTRLHTGDNREVIVPNGKIYGDTITNYSAHDTRRVDMIFGIGYDDDLRKAKAVLERLVNEDERILKSPPPVIAVAELADASVNFTVRVWVRSGDYWKVLWDMNEKVKLTFDEEGISIPYPQMDVHLKQETSTS